MASRRQATPAMLLSESVIQKSLGCGSTYVHNAYIGAYAHMLRKKPAMTSDIRLRAENCNCLAVRQAARHITQVYDQCLALATDDNQHPSRGPRDGSHDAWP